MASPAGAALIFEESSFAKTTLYKSGAGFGLSMAPTSGNMLIDGQAQLNNMAATTSR